MLRLRQTLEDEQVTLRQWIAADVEFYVAHFGNPTTAQYLGGTLTRPQAWRHLASVIGHWSLRGFGPYAVVDRPSQRLVGCTGAWEPDGWPCLEFVFWFSDTAYESTTALRAARLSLDAMRTAFGEEILTGFIHPMNHAALGLVRQLGGTLHGEEPLLHFGPHVRTSYPGSRHTSRASVS